MFIDLDREKALYLQRATISFFEREGRRFPWRETRDPYVILISELLLQKTTSKQVLGVLDEFFKSYPSINDLAKAREEDVEKIVGKLGLRKRAKFLKGIALKVVREWGGRIPDDERLLELKGVGRYTANAVLCFAFNKRVPVVDTNVARVLRRYFGVSEEKPAYADKNVWELAEAVIPEERYREFNYGLIDISAKHCRPRPLCTGCPLKTYCSYARNV